MTDLFAQQWDEMSTLDACILIEETCASIYYKFAGIFAASPNFFSLWTEMAMEEEKHADEFRAIKAIHCSNYDCSDIENDLIKMILVKLKSLNESINSKTRSIWDALLTALILEKSVEKYHLEASKEIDPLPVSAPGLGDRGMRGVPLGLKGCQVRFCQMHGRCLIDGFEIFGNLFALLPRDIVQTVTHHMHDAELDLGVWINSLNRLGKTLEAIHAGDEEVFHDTVLQFSDNLEPELGSLSFCRPHAENFLDPFHGDGNGKVDGLVDYLAVMQHLDPNSIEVDNRVDFIERSALPEFDFFRYCFGNLRAVGL
jgi:hypothetical protein